MEIPTGWERLAAQQRAMASQQSLGLLGGLGLGGLSHRSDVMQARIREQELDALRYGMSITKMEISYKEKSFRDELQEEIDEWLEN